MLCVWSPQPDMGSWHRLPAAGMRRRQRRRKKGRGPAHPRPVLAPQEAPERGEDFPAGPAASQGPAPRRGEGQSLGGSPQAPSASQDREEGASRGEGPKRRGEEATVQMEMKEHLEEVGDGQKQPPDAPSWSPPDRECHGARGIPDGGRKPPGGDSPICPQGSPDLGHPVTRSPLVLSLFYCPSEEEGDEGGGCSGADWPNVEEEPEDDARCEADEVLWGALSRGQDPFNPLRLAGAPPGPTPPRPKDQEFSVSFYLCGPASEAVDVGDPWRRPEKPWPMRRGGPGRTHGWEPGAGDPVKVETSDLVGSRTAKKVRFSPVVTVHPLVVWSFASRAARRGPWEELARDRSRFRRRIEQLGAILEPCLEPGHRARAWGKIQGAAPEPVGPETPFPRRDVSLQLCSERMEDPGVREGQAEKHRPLPSAYRGVEDPGVRDGRLG